MNTPSLAHVSLTVGLLILLVGLPGALAPSKWAAALRAFPRHAPSAWALTAVDMLWVSMIVLHASLGSYNGWKPAIYVLAPISFFLLTRYLDELLAPRALGGLLLLMPDPMLDAARWQPSNWHFVITVLAYIFAIAGMLLVLGPYRFRLWTSWWIERDSRLRACSVVKIIFGALLIFFGLRIF